MHKRKAPIQIFSSILVSNLEEKTKIINKIPKIELSNETLLHQKVQTANVYVATPYGTKFFAWITTAQHVELNNNTNKKDVICIFIESGPNTYLPSRNIFYVPLITNSNKLNDIWTNHYIFHGILFNLPNITNQNQCPTKKHTYYAVDYVYDCKTAHISGYKIYAQTLQIINYIFRHPSFIEDVRGPLIDEHMLHFGSPIMKPHFSDLINHIQDLPYTIQYIHFRYANDPENKNIEFVKYFKPNKKTNVESSPSFSDQSSSVKPIVSNNIKRLSHAVFKIYSMQQSDTYKLFALKTNGNNSIDSEDNVLVDIAYIPNYKTSIMMNSLFRNGKENNNLDCMEESDDEEEFENQALNNVVDLEKSIAIKCEYSPKFKKWIPVTVTDQAIITTDLLGI